MRPGGQTRTEHLLPDLFTSQAWSLLAKEFKLSRRQREIARLGHVSKVLVVDDDRGFCQLVDRMLTATRNGFRVRQAYDGQDGLAQMRASRPDLVLLDLIMPDLDGFQVLEEMRDDPALARVPVVLVTAADLAEDMLMQRSSELVVRRPDGLRLSEVLRCLQALVGLLQPRYDERWVPATLSSAQGN